jgi:hypothetical protein
MDAGLNDGATLESMNWRANNIEVTASGNSNARVHSKDDALIISESNSQVKVEGGARIRNTRYEN